jgi:hypothetical protein
MEKYDLLHCIDKGLEPFGSNVKQSIFWKLSVLHNFSREDVTENPEHLVEIIRETLGDSAVEVEKSIIHEIRTCFEIVSEDSTGLTEAIRAAKRQIIDVSSGGGLVAPKSV